MTASAVAIRVEVTPAAARAGYTDRGGPRPDAAGVVAAPIEWLEEAAREPGALHFCIPIDPIWKYLAPHPGFQRIRGLFSRNRF